MNKVFNLFRSDYSLLASFTNEERCKQFLMTDSLPAAQVAWVGVFPDNSIAFSAIPMWEPYDFVDNFPHKS